MSTIATALTPLERAQQRLYSISGGSIDSGDVRLARMTTYQRMDYFRSEEFRHWVASEIAAGREVFWLKDVDKTQGAGDIFTFFYKWRADNNKFTPDQLKLISDFLRSHKASLVKVPTTWIGRQLARIANALSTSKNDSFAPHEVISTWLSKEDGGDGIGMMDFWTNIYWPSQLGLTRDEKLAQVRAFAPLYADKVYPGVFEENKLLESLGVTVVIVSNGDQELAIAAAPILGVKPENVVGSHLIYNAAGVSTGINHRYEIEGPDWHARPQPGKNFSFHYWLHINRGRFGWKSIDERKYVIAGRDGDSASTDGGMMILMQTVAIGNFMVNTPGEPNRLATFHKVASKYGWTRGQFITLDQAPSKTGFRPE